MSPHPGELVSAHRPAARPQPVRAPRGERDQEPVGGPVQAEIAKMQKVSSFYVFLRGMIAMKQVVMWQDAQKCRVFTWL